METFRGKFRPVSLSESPFRPSSKIALNPVTQAVSLNSRGKLQSQWTIPRKRNCFEVRVVEYRVIDFRETPNNYRGGSPRSRRSTRSLQSPRLIWCLTPADVHTLVMTLSPLTSLVYSLQNSRRSAPG